MVVAISSIDLVVESRKGMLAWRSNASAVCTSNRQFAGEAYLLSRLRSVRICCSRSAVIDNP